MKCVFVKASERTYVCKRCQQRPVITRLDWQPDKVHRQCTGAPGLGDYVAKAIETIMPWTRKKKCEPCAKRQEKLNELGRRIMG